MSSEPAVLVENIGKMFAVFNDPADRLKQMLVPNIQQLFGLKRTQYYKEFWAIRDVSLRVEPGETVGIVGRNGAGKSTLLQLISGTLAPTEGRSVVNGRLSALLELGTGFNPEFTGRENVTLNGQLKGFTRREMEDRFDEIAAFADIGDFIEQPVKTYSSGMLVRLAFAVHAILDPDVLIVDEALAVGDVRFQAKCFDRLAALKARGTSILFVSHDVGAVRRFCEKAVWLDNGQTVATGDTYEVTSAFTAFMLSGERISARRITDPQPEARTHVVTDSAGSVAPDKITEPSTLEDGTLRPFAERFPYPRAGQQPIERFGSETGLIVSAAITDMDEQALTEIEPHAPFQIHVVADLPETLDPVGLSIGFDIRQLSGINVLVRSTYDTSEASAVRPGRRVHVVFTPENILAAGDYRLSLAVENRSLPTPNYYDFLDAALLFKVGPARYQWGVVIPHVPTTVTEVKA